jgi:hypothetical protein
MTIGSINPATGAELTRFGRLHGRGAAPRGWGATNPAAQASALVAGRERARGGRPEHALLRVSDAAQGPARRSARARGLAVSVIDPKETANCSSSMRRTLILGHSHREQKRNSIEEIRNPDWRASQLKTFDAGGKNVDGHDRPQDVEAATTKLRRTQERSCESR